MSKEFNFKYTAPTAEERKEIDSTPISASAVRKYIRTGEISQVEKIVPKTTYNYLIDNKLI